MRDMVRHWQDMFHHHIHDQYSTFYQLHIKSMCLSFIQSSLSLAKVLLVVGLVLTGGLLSLLFASLAAQT